MTNGEKLISDFPYIKIKGQDKIFTTIQIDTTGTGTPIIVYTEWWNAKYKEPNTKNNSSVDCITKTDAIAIIQDMHGLARADVISDAVNKIIATPAITPQSRKGHWIECMPGGSEEWSYKCSECNFWKYKKTINLSKFKFCPHCGADMQNTTKHEGVRKGKPIEGNNDSYNCENWIP